MTQSTALDDRVLSIEIAAPIDKVWSEITKTGAIQRALYNTVLETDLKPGSRLRYYSPNKKRVFIVGEVVEVSPPTKFSHTYLFLQNMVEPTLVTWELHEIPSGCRVTLTHSGWTEANAKHHKDAAKGWTEILGMLKQQVETGDIPFKFKVIYSLMGLFLGMLPKKTRVEEVEKAGW